MHGYVYLEKCTMMMPIGITIRETCMLCYHVTISQVSKINHVVVFTTEEENIYFPFILPRTLVLDGHQCSSPNTGSSAHFRNVTVVDSRGKNKSIFCTSWHPSKAASSVFSRPLTNYISLLKQNYFNRKVIVWNTTIEIGYFRKKTYQYY